MPRRINHRILHFYLDKITYSTDPKQLEEIYEHALKNDISPDKKIKLAQEIIEIDESYKNGAAYLLPKISRESP